MRDAQSSTNSHLKRERENEGEKKKERTMREILLFSFYLNDILNVLNKTKCKFSIKLTNIPFTFINEISIHKTKLQTNITLLDKVTKKKSSDEHMRTRYFSL